MNKEHSMIVGGTVYDTEYHLYNVVLVTNVPRQGGVDRYTDIINPIPVEFEEAARRVHRMKQLARDNATGGFSKVADCYWQEVHIPATATEQDRWNAVWSNIHNMQFPDAVSKHEAWLIRHYGLAVEDAEVATESDRLLTKLTVLHSKCEKSKEIAAKLRELDLSGLREKLMECFCPHAEALAGGAA